MEMIGDPNVRLFIKKRAIEWEKANKPLLVGQFFELCDVQGGKCYLWVDLNHYKGSVCCTKSGFNTS